MFRPGGGGQGYESNPYRVIRFKNSTPFALESGPISIYSGGSFVGEGISEPVSAGVAVTIPLRTAFQFRAEDEAPLAFLAITMPPWPGMDEAVAVEGRWTPTV